MVSPTDPFPVSDSAKRIHDLEGRVAALGDQLRQMTDQTLALSKIVLERARKDELRISILEAHRVNHHLARASQFFPKSRNVVFVGRATFADNIKYAYLAFRAKAREKNIQFHFLPHDREQFETLQSAGLPCLSPDVGSWTLADAKILLSAAVAVVCDNFHLHSTMSPIHFSLLQGARTIQLWHGIPIKEIGLQHVFAPGGQNMFLTEILGSSGFFDAFVGTSALSEADWRRAFAFREFAPLGYPRNDVLYREPTPEDLIGVDKDSLRTAEIARRSGKPVILYAPTFRDHIGPDWLERVGIFPVLIDAAAKGREVLVNLHPFEQAHVETLSARYPALRFVKPSTDIYPVLKHVDVLLTDYSSLAFDYLHADRPLVFYRPDHEDYMRRARALIPGRETYTAGQVTFEPGTLAQALNAAAETARDPARDAYRTLRGELRRRLFDDQDGKAGARVADLIEKHVEAALSAGIPTARTLA